MLKRIETKLVRIYRTIFYFLVISFAFLIIRLLLRVKLEGKENIPKKGRFILAANHQNFFDGFFLAYVIGPLKMVNFVVAKRALRINLFQFLLTSVGAVIIGSGADEYQRALKKLNRILSRGGVIGIFPEGDVFNNKLPRKFKGGVAKLSLDSKTKVVPVYLNGTYDLRNIKYLLKRPEITIRIGKPLDLYNYSLGNNLEQLAMIVREKIIELMGINIKEYDNLAMLDLKNLSVAKLSDKEEELQEKINKVKIVR